jgi:hypothetical protein
MAPFWGLREAATGQHFFGVLKTPKGINEGGLFGVSFGFRNVKFCQVRAETSTAFLVEFLLSLVY